MPAVTSIIAGVAGAMVGERDVYYKGEIKNSLAVMQSLACVHTFLPKEGLAVMNGTAVMTALACLAFDRADYLAKLTSRITALASLIKGNSHHFDDILFSVKPQRVTSKWLRGSW